VEAPGIEPGSGKSFTRLLHAYPVFWIRRQNHRQAGFFTTVPSKISLANAPGITYQPSRLNYASESPAGMTFWDVAVFFRLRVR